MGEAEELAAPEPRMNDEPETEAVDEPLVRERGEDAPVAEAEAEAETEAVDPVLPEAQREAEIEAEVEAASDGDEDEGPAFAEVHREGKADLEMAEAVSHAATAEGLQPAEVAGAGPTEEADDGRRWYVVHCYSGYEAKVRHNLEQRVETMGMKGKIFDVVIPTEEEIEVKDGKRRTVERHVFPGYILVQMLMDEDSWYVVRNTPGVTGFVGMGNEPTALRPEEVQQIIRRMEAEAPRVKVTYKAGQRVRIIDGPFNDFIGTVDEIDMERAKVRVMVSFFGRDTPVELDFLQVEKA